MTPSSDVFVHSHALCESDQVGPGTRIWAFAHVMEGAQIGADCNVCGHAFVESGAIVGDRVTIKNSVLIWDRVRVEDDVFLGPNVVFTNDPNPRVRFKKDPSEFVPTVVGRGATIGAQSTIVCGVTLGPHCFVGAGSVVRKHVPAYGLVVGNPARHIGWMCECGTRLDEDGLACPCGRKYVRIPDGGGLKPVERDDR